MTSIVIDVSDPLAKEVMRLMGSESEIFPPEAHCPMDEDLACEAERLMEIGDHKPNEAVIDHLRWCRICFDALEQTLHTSARGGIVAQTLNDPQCDASAIREALKGNFIGHVRAHLWHCAECRNEAIELLFSEQATQP